MILDFLRRRRKREGERGKYFVCGEKVKYLVDGEKYLEKDMEENIWRMGWRMEKEKEEIFGEGN